MKHFIGIDPGLRNGGIVLINQSAIIKASGIKTLPKNQDFSGDPNFTSAVNRSEEFVSNVLKLISEWNSNYDIEAIFIEGFVDLASRKKHFSGDQQLFIKDRWKTPLVIGMLHPYLAKFNVIYQNPAILSGYKADMVALKEKRWDVLPVGAQLLKNDHMRSAWCHADCGMKNYYLEPSA